MSAQRSPGAMRAAQVFRATGLGLSDQMTDRLAEIIDNESGLPELLASAKAFAEAFSKSGRMGLRSIPQPVQNQLWQDMVRPAIAKAEGAT